MIRKRAARDFLDPQLENFIVALARAQARLDHAKWSMWRSGPRKRVLEALDESSK